jgi:DNA mismatch repair protein MutS
MAFRSILYETDPPPQLPDQVPALDFFVNLNLDQVVAAIAARRDEYNLQPIFHTPPPDPETVHYRHEVMQDLEQDVVLEFVKGFSAKMRSMREQVARLNRLHYRFQKEAVFLDAIAFYCDAVSQLAKDLKAADLKSRGLDGLRRHVEDYVHSLAFSSLENAMKEIKRDLAAIEYELLIGNSSVYGAQV